MVDLVAKTYANYKTSKAINPPSQFLAWPGTRNRIIALPAALLDEESGSVGLKWIASFPENIEHHLRRASAVMVVNSPHTGRALAVLEASDISAHRTAASAALAARLLGNPKGNSLGIVGGGEIATETLHYLDALNILPDRITISDPRPLKETPLGSFEHCNLHSDALLRILDADTVLLTTTASAPHLPQGFRTRPGQLVLNLSLRDLHPESLLDANNIFDDVEHCLTARTSPHLLSMTHPREEFVTGTLADVMDGDAQLSPSKGTIFSPFGMGILDLALANFIIAFLPEGQSGYEKVKFSTPKVVDR